MNALNVTELYALRLILLYEFYLIYLKKKDIYTKKIVEKKKKSALPKSYHAEVHRILLR